MKFLTFCLFIIIFLFEQTNSATIISDNEEEPEHQLGIVNGEEAAPDEGLHVVEIFESGKPNCGGSLIDSTTVISAAHCAFGYDVSKLTIRYGTHKLYHSEYKDISVKWTKIHPKFSESRRIGKPNQRNDISIFKLSEPVEKGENVEFIKLQQTELKNVEGPFTLYGFGTIDVNGDHFPENLQKMSPYNVTEGEYQEVFENVFDEYYEVVPGTLLVRDPDAADCGGDSGSGLIYNERLIAVVSGGAETGGCNPGEIETFARVDLPENFEFIQRHRR